MLGSVPYFYLIIICLLLICFRRFLPQKFKILPVILLCTVLIFFSGFRYKVGQDYENYVFWFRNLSDSSYDISVEPSHYLIVKLCNSMNADFQLMFLIYSFLTIFFIALFIEKESINPELSWIIFICIGPYYISTFNGIRQWVSVAIFAYSIISAKKGNIKKYFILNIIGTSFHYSSLLTLPLYFIIRIKKLNLGKAFVILFVIFFFSLIGLTSQFLNAMGAGGLSTSEMKVSIDYSYYIFILLSLLCYLLFYFFYDEYQSEDYIYRNMNVLSGLTIISALVISNVSNIVFLRLNTYFFISYLVLIPYVLNCFKQNKKFITPFIISFSLVYFFIIVTNNSTINLYDFNFNIFYVR